MKMRKNEEIDFYKRLANELISQGFRCFLYDEDIYAWLYVITPNNSWLYIDNGDYSGYNIYYEYKPSKDFGTGCRCNESPLYEITASVLNEAEQYGKNFGTRGWKNVPNRYDGKMHREMCWKKPMYYTNAYEAMKQSSHFNKLTELKENSYSIT